MQKRRIWAGSVNSTFSSSAWFPCSVTLPSLTLLYFKPVDWDNLLGERGVRKPALLWQSPPSPPQENVFLLVEGFETCILTSANDCKIFRRWRLLYLKRSHTKILEVEQNNCASLTTTLLLFSLDLITAEWQNRAGSLEDLTLYVQKYVDTRTLQPYVIVTRVIQKPQAVICCLFTRLSINWLTANYFDDSLFWVIFQMIRFLLLRYVLCLWGCWSGQKKTASPRALGNYCYITINYSRK